MIQPIIFLPNDSGSQKLQCIAEGINGIIHAMNKGSAPSASSNTTQAEIAIKHMENLSRLWLDDHACEHSVLIALSEACNDYRSQLSAVR